MVYLVIFNELAKQRNITLDEFMVLFKLGVHLEKHQRIAEELKPNSKKGDNKALVSKFVHIAEYMSVLGSVFFVSRKQFVTH